MVIALGQKENYDARKWHRYRQGKLKGSEFGKESS